MGFFDSPTGLIRKLRLVVAVWVAALVSVSHAQSKPNIILIFADDLGYGDLSCYGQRQYQTPRLDQMAKEGVRFTDFLVASPGCSPSRAAILTGCQPVRIGIPQVLSPGSGTGLNPEEVTVAEMLKEQGYATAMAGKWHIGVNNLMPPAHGFDQYYGLPYSNDMWPKNGKNWPPLHWFKDSNKGDEIKELSDQAQITKKLTQFSQNFIKSQSGKPFFLYLAHSMPHVPIAASENFLGKSGAGLYGDTIQELDWSVGQILDTLREEGLDENTLVFFTSDNGPWIPYGNHAGSSGPLRNGKGTTFEGGVRVPAIAWWPGQLPAGYRCDVLTTSLDFLPTVARLTSASLPTAKIDGHDAWNVWSKKTQVSPTKHFPYYIWPGELQAIRVGRYKLHFEHTHRFQSGPPGQNGAGSGETQATIAESLFDLENDLGETTDIAANHPELVKKMKLLADSIRQDIGDTKLKIKGRGARPPGKVVPTAR